MKPTTTYISHSHNSTETSATVRRELEKIAERAYSYHEAAEKNVQQFVEYAAKNSVIFKTAEAVLREAGFDNDSIDWKGIYTLVEKRIKADKRKEERQDH